MLTLTYGELPTHDQFDSAFYEFCPDSHYSFSNDPRVGTCRFTVFALWRQILKAHDEYVVLLSGDEFESDELGFIRKIHEEPTDPEIVGDWISTVLYSIGIEWV